MSVSVVAYHNARHGELNDNNTFLSVLEDQSRRSEAKQDLEEYYDHVITLFKKGKHYVVYFTVDKEDGVSGYIVQGATAKECVEYLAIKRGVEPEYVQEIIKDVTI